MNRGAFNNGVYGMNLELWRQRNVGKEVEYWIDVVGKIITGNLAIDLHTIETHGSGSCQGV